MANPMNFGELLGDTSSEILEAPSPPPSPPPPLPQSTSHYHLTIKDNMDSGINTITITSTHKQSIDFLRGYLNTYKYNFINEFGLGIQIHSHNQDNTPNQNLYYAFDIEPRYGHGALIRPIAIPAILAIVEAVLGYTLLIQSSTDTWHLRCKKSLCTITNINIWEGARERTPWMPVRRLLARRPSDPSSNPSVVTDIDAAALRIKL
ncbi:hypothetical protein PT974_01426 [Cladobotryum mycophilum]|uniref:Uncharacterized protein n=1 Tax=Cladobotryum mycophilum TaxID=491253 RepID=A0ABR0T3X4_9HYPO